MAERFDKLESKGDGPYIKSVDGFVICITGLNEETSEEDLVDTFADHGEIKNCVLNLDRKTGYAKGYALIEYSTAQEAKAAILAFNNNKEVGGRQVRVDWAFKKSPK